MSAKAEAVPLGGFDFSSPSDMQRLAGEVARHMGARCVIPLVRDISDDSAREAFFTALFAYYVGVASAAIGADLTCAVLEKMKDYIRESQASARASSH